MKIDLMSRIASFSGLNYDFIHNAMSIARHQIHQFTVPKSNGKFRIIRVPPIESKLLQNSVVDILSETVVFSAIATAYFKGASIQANARLHANNAYFTRVDLKDFFPSITFNDFCTALSSEKIELSSADLEMIRIICFDHGDKLSIGFPSSPFISNLVMKQIDTTILEALDSLGSFALTRYSDDFVFSSNSIESQNSAYKMISEVISNSISPKLSINSRKTRKMSLGRGNALITGVKILPGGRLTVHPKVKSDARFMMHTIETKKVERDYYEKARGLLSYIKSVDPGLFNDLAIKYYKAFAAVMSPLRLRTDFTSNEIQGQTFDSN